MRFCICTKGNYYSCSRLGGAEIFFAAIGRMIMKKMRLKIKSYNVVREKLEEWVPYGIRRYYKYHDEKEPKDMGALQDAIEDAVMLGLDGVVDWEESK
jgi:hypothetical protein